MSEKDSGKPSFLSEACDGDYIIEVDETPACPVAKKPAAKKAEVIDGCEKCTLKNNVSHLVDANGTGPCPNPVAIVGEAPRNPKDSPIKVAFGGAPGGSLLTTVFKNVGLDLNEVYSMNAVRCKCIGAPTPAQIKHCAAKVHAELERVNPKYVLLLGASAVKAMLGSGNVTQIHGTVIEKEGRFYVPTFHPAAIMQDPGKDILFRKDIAKFAALVKGLPSAFEHRLNWHLVCDDVVLGQMFDDIAKAPAVSFDLETSGLDPYVGVPEIRLLGIATDDNQWLIPVCVKNGIGDSFELAQGVMQAVAEALAGKKVVGHNAKFDNKWLRRCYGVRFPLTFDTMLAAHILDENHLSYSLKYLARLMLDASEWDIDSKSKTGENIAFEKYCEYCAWDVYYTLKLYHKLKADLLEQPKLFNIFVKQQMPASDAFEDIEEWGVQVDRAKLATLDAALIAKIADLQAKLNALRPGVNWNSPKQVGMVMYGPHDKGGWGLEIIETTDTGAPSTKDGILQKLKDKHAGVQLLLDYREAIKLKSSFVDGWQKFLDAEDRMHPQYKLHGTKTGRLSCGDPNLQQVPRVGIACMVDGKEVNLGVKPCITARKGYVFAEFDYSQIELRIAAWISGDQEMLRVFQEGKIDIHTKTAQIVTGKAEVTKEERYRAKAVNFGFLYGMGAQSFQEYAFTKYGVSLTPLEAQHIRDRFFQVYHGLPKWHQRQRNIVKLHAEIETAFGRVRHLPEIMSPEKKKQGEAERQAINTPVQSFASDIALCALVELSQKLDKDKVRIIGAVHDAILFEIREDTVDEIVPQIKTIMEHPALIYDFAKINLNVPIIAEHSVKKSGWGS